MLSHWIINHQLSIQNFNHMLERRLWLSCPAKTDFHVGCIRNQAFLSLATDQVALGWSVFGKVFSIVIIDQIIFINMTDQQEVPDTIGFLTDKILRLKHAIFPLPDVGENGVEGLFGDGDRMAAKEVEVAPVLGVEVFEVFEDIGRELDWLAGGFEHEL